MTVDGDLAERARKLFAGPVESVSGVFPLVLVYEVDFSPTTRAFLHDVMREVVAVGRALVSRPTIVFADEDTALSGGNFHAQPIAFAADTIGTRSIARSKPDGSVSSVCRK